MRSEIDILEEYSTAFRDLINERVWDKGESPAKLLRLNSDNDWSFICVAMDIVGDASLAMRNFAEFALEGPTKYNDVGERYLRLYGVLSAVYIQQQAVLKLYALMGCPSPKEQKGRFEALVLRELRHKLASHGLDYLEPDGSSPSAYVPVRMDLAGFSCTITKNRGDGSETIRIDEALVEHCKLTVSVLDSVYEKSVKTLFRGQKKRIEQFNQKLEELRQVRDGSLIIRFGSDDGASKISRLIINAGARDEDA